MSERRKRQRDERSAREQAEQDAIVAARASEAPVPPGFLSLVDDLTANYGAEEQPAHLADQWLAAGRDLDALMRDGTPNEMLQKGKGTRRAFAFGLAAVQQCRPCDHLRATPQQPGFVFLGLRSAYCQPCVARLDGMPPLSADVMAADQCDLCGRSGVTYFHDLIWNGITGYALTGNICTDCYETLSTTVV